MVQQLSTNTFGCAKWIVSPTASDGTHTTIAAALTSASSGDTIFIRDGTYTENLTHKAGVTITTFAGDGYTPNVVILGNITCSGAGTFTIANVQLKTNSANALTVSGSSATIVYLIGTYLNFSNNTGISFTTTNTGSSLNLFNCTGNLGTTGITYYTKTSTGVLNIFRSDLENGGNSVTASDSSAGIVGIVNSHITSVLTTSSTCILVVENSNLDTSLINTTTITTSGTSSASISQCTIGSGTASSISIGTGTVANITSTTINSSNTNAITGAGTLNKGTIDFVSSNNINTTSVIRLTTTQSVAQQVAASTASTFTVTTVIPFDNTIPQNTEGDQILTLAITPKNANNILVIQASALITCSALINASGALFQDSTANALYATSVTGAGTGENVILPMTYYMTAGTTSSTTFKLRIGPNTGTLHINADNSGTRIFGGVALVTMTIVEYSP